jgi:signal transduction histidine kinase
MMVKSRSDKSEVVEVIDLNDILRQELEFLNADPKFNKIEKQTLFHPAPLNIKVIPGEISQVFSNIILNAVDALFNRKDAKIIVKSGFSHKFAWFSVEDNGSGIPANIIEKIFDPFYSTKKLKKLENDNSPTGTGIGLHYCRQTIDSYSGKIDVQSKEGFGASFTVSIPLA